MPELPEVETVKNGLAPVMAGAVIGDIILRRKDLRIPFPKNLSAMAKGQIITRLTRRAKYILIHLSNHKIMVLHLGMSGQIKIIEHPKAYKPAAHDHMMIVLKNAPMIVFHDPRRFGLVYCLEGDDDLQTHPAFATLGPEPLSNDFNAPAFWSVLKGLKAPIKHVLLDQRRIAGIGNIYASEALFYAHIHPQRAAGTLSQGEVENLVRAIRRVLEKAIAAGGSTLRDYKKADGTLGYFQHQFAVYGKEGEACQSCPIGGKKKSVIQKIVQSGRATYFCPRCQK
jgi:formamidopyrimidine-DNA glycosylase